MTGNISKSKGFKGEAGPVGPQGPRGEKGDAPSIAFRYDENTGNLFYSSDGILYDKDYIDSQGITGAIQEASNKAAQTPASITLYADKWEQGDVETLWSQVVVVENATITEYSKVDLQPSAEQLLIFHEKDVTFVAENDGGVVTVFCIGQKPVNDYVMQATVSEVVVNV